MFLISVDSTPDTHRQLCITLIYVLPSGSVKRFVTFVPIRSHSRMEIAEVTHFLAREFDWCHILPQSVIQQCSTEDKGCV